uniref:Uncharacterized protein n=1 Tax=Arundo donax TaxID=35708 RepID=A0A0A9A044_ARUDO
MMFPLSYEARSGNVTISEAKLASYPAFALSDKMVWAQASKARFLML